VTESTAPATTPVGDPRDEFSFLPGQAGRFGVALPPTVRLTLTGERALSAVRFGEGRPRVVLLHGAGLNAHTWDNTALVLGRPVLALDLPGHGDSGWREDADYRPRTLAADVVRAIESWAEAPVVLVGHSLGGLTAAAVAAARPDLVAALILVDITPGAAGGSGSAELRRFYEVTDFPSREAVVEHATAFGLGGSPEDSRRGVFHNTRVREDGRVEWKHHFARLAQQALPDGAGRAAAPVVDDSAWADLSAVEAPVTLVRGTRGFVDDAAAADFSARLPEAGVATIDAPHNIQEVAPAELAARIASVLQTLPTDPNSADADTAAADPKAEIR